VSEPEDYADETAFDLLVLTGVWADATLVHRGRAEFTIDFVRQLPRQSGRLLVARAIVAPAVAVDLRDQLDEAWQRYSDWSMPGGVDDG
jgi:hypothetical protein